ncbi:molecular chaperone [Pseudomonas chlororaphis]|uniref:fimbrial biogenesis chaperone n=1 Tax=Pseudomonas chlororaphis TaxID=587753 RepID=UPI001928C229|nr:molecular chaperone [Pseudomonas chlororaphis]QQX57086.1 molecular chaperone [Pseudomonas chlororaphis subsp. aurantiaca]
MAMFRALSGLLIVGCLAGQALGATLQVSPVKVDFSSGQNAAGLTLNNPGDTPVYGQVRVFRWDQDANGDVLSPSPEVVASPPIIQLTGGGQQLIRLVRVQPGNTAVEQSYRLLIDEIPPPDSGKKHAGVMIRMRYSVPVFVAPVGNTSPKLIWRVARQQDGQWFLHLDNQGLRHTQVGALMLQDATGKVLQVSDGLLGYVLAGHKRQWPLRSDGPAKLGGQLVIKVNLDGRPNTFTVTGED